MNNVGVVLELHELDELNSKIGFVGGVLELLKALSSNDLLETVEEKAISSLVGEAQEKLQMVHEMLNSREQ